MVLCRKHPALIDGINGSLDSSAFEEKAAQRFLEGWAAGKRGPSKFLDLEYEEDPFATQHHCLKVKEVHCKMETWQVYPAKSKHLPLKI